MGTIETIFHPDNGNLVIERKADCQPVLDEVKAIKDVTDGKSKSGDLYHVARVPMIFIEQYCNDNGVSVHEFMANNTHMLRLLNDANYKHFRIWEGNL